MRFASQQRQVAMPSDEEAIKARGPPGKKLAGKAEIQAEQLIVRITSEVIDRVKNRFEQAQTCFSRSTSPRGSKGSSRTATATLTTSQSRPKVARTGNGLASASQSAHQ